MFRMNNILLITTGFLTGALTVEAYCSCKCDSPEIPYTRTSYAAPVPNVPYKYTFAANAIQRANHILKDEGHHSDQISVPIVILPHVNNEASFSTNSDYHKAVENLQISSQDHHLRATSLESSDSGKEFSTNLHNNNIQDSGHHQLIEHNEGSDQFYHHHQEDKDHREHHEYKKKNHNIHYKFGYAVNDHKTGDIKRHNEERKGDDVVGEYSLLEEDGNVRTVKYQADWKTGFHAQVFNSKPRHG